MSLPAESTKIKPSCNLLRKQYDVRCFNCNRLFTKVIVEVFCPDYEENYKKMMSQLGIEIKLGTETKCLRCKETDYSFVLI